MKQTSNTQPGKVWMLSLCLLLAWDTAIAEAGIWEGSAGGMTFALAVDPSGAVYAGTARGGIFKSTTGGRSWRQVGPSQGDAQIKTLAVEAAGTLYAGAANGSILRRTNAEKSWRVVKTSQGNGAIQSLAIDHRTRPSTIYAGTASGTILTSTDGGASWNASDAGRAHQSVHVFAIDARQRPSIVYAGTSGGLYRSKDNGGSWSKLCPLAVRALALDPSRPGTLYAVLSQISSVGKQNPHSM